MDYLDLTDEFLQDAQKVMSYNSDIPFQYRILGKLNFDDDLYNAKRFTVLIRIFPNISINMNILKKWKMIVFSKSVLNLICQM